MVQGITLANILSILAMARKDGDTERDCMFFCISSRGALLGMSPEERASQDPVTSFGDPYIRCVEGVAWWAESALSLYLPLPCPQTPLYAVCRGVPGVGPHGDVLTQGACTAAGAQGRARVLPLAAQRRARGGHRQDTHTPPLPLVACTLSPCVSVTIRVCVCVHVCVQVCDLLVEMEDARDIKDNLRSMPGAEEGLSECLLRLLRQAVPEKKAQVKVNDRICQYLVR